MPSKLFGHATAEAHYEPDLFVCYVWCFISMANNLNLRNPKRDVWGKKN